jgi:alpha-L-rhamnosidase
MARTWTADVIAADDDHAGAPLLRTEFEPVIGHGDVLGAELHVSALGVFSAFLAGRPVSDDVLSPGWSSYEWRVRYRSYDVTALLADAGPRVVLGLALGNGWYRGRLGWTGRRALYGDELGAIAELEIRFADGYLQTVGTDATWRSGPSEVLVNDLYDGETIDARLRDLAWLSPGAEPAGWGGVHSLVFDRAKLTPYVGPPVTRQEMVPAVKVWTSPAGRTLVDFGQNLVGWVRFTVQGEAGARITLRHAEVLEDDELGVRPLRTAEATDRFVLSGGVDTFEPTLTFHGFRYVEVDGWPGEVGPGDLEAVVVHSDLTRIGTFECSDPMVNQLHRNVVWGLRGNFLDVPTDCPQRDERLGWTGDLAVFAPTAAYLYDVRAFLDDWLADVGAEQAAAGGRVPYVVPDTLKYDGIPDEFHPVDSAAIWSDVAAWAPWALWEAYGDVDLLARHLPLMLAHVRHVEGLLSPSDLWDATFQFGDWLDPDAPPENPAAAKADPGVVATASLYRSVVMTAAAARIVGRDDDAAAMTRLAGRLHAAFLEHYVTTGGDGAVLVRSDCQTVYALAICFGLLDGERRAQAGARLAALVKGAAARITTGFAGTPYVLEALSSTGHTELAYRMLLQQENPGWMYPITMGATTIWERWDSMLPDGSINPGEMTSFNHYALGAVADWLHRVVAGIAPAEPGYASVLVAPRPGGGITSARGSVRTPHGVVSTTWALEDGRFTLDVEIPDGVPAVVRLPGGAEHRVGGGAHRFTEPFSGPEPTA